MGNVLSPSGTIESNVVKYEKHVDGPNASQDKCDIIRRIREAIDPAAAAQVYMEAAQIIADGIQVIAQRLIESGTPKEFANVQAYEIYRGAQRLSSVGKSLGYAEENLEDGKTYTMPDKSFINNFVSAVESISDEEILELFGKVLSGEMESQGSFSKRTLDILSCMSSAEARNFKKLCSYSTSDSAGLAEVPIVRRDKGSTGSFNDRSILFIDLMELEAIGLYKSDAAFNIKIEPGDDLVLHTAKHTIRISPGDNATTFSIDGGSFTRYGVELSKLCEIGTVDGLEDLICEWASDRGLTSSIDNKTAWRP